MTVKGVISSVLFRNDENGFTVFNVKNKNTQLVCCGIVLPLNVGQCVIIDGEIVIDKKYGKQLKVKSLSFSKIDDEDNILNYLKSGAIKGIGKILSQKIVEKFGLESINVIEKNPELLSSINGINFNKAKKIQEDYTLNKKKHDILAYLVNNGLSIRRSTKIYDTYKEKTIEIISANPYKLVEDIEHIGFLTADEIAMKLGIARDSIFRARAGIIHILNEVANNNGSTMLPRQNCVEKTLLLLKCDNIIIIDEAIEKLKEENKIVSINLNNIDNLMLVQFNKMEKFIAQKIVTMLLCSNLIKFDAEEEIQQIEKINNIKLHDFQKKAIESCVNNGVSIITGGPGTGKTTIIKSILTLFNNHNKKTVLLAPTGRAAKKLSESSGKEASTIHRLLMSSKGSLKEGDFITEDVVIVDEMSMIDTFLFYNLLKRLHNDNKLVLVGDKNQLPSIGAGNVFASLMNSGIVPLTHLDFIYRQNEESDIIINAYKINNGQMPILDGGKDFFLLKTENIVEKIIELVKTRIPNYLMINSDKIQVLTPLKKGKYGSLELNIALQKVLNSQNHYLEYNNFKYKEGDKIIHLVNNYKLKWQKYNSNGYYQEGEGVFNGDLGKIIKIENDKIIAEFEDGRIVTYNGEDREQIAPAYAITVHKSQGSEFEAVVIPLFMANPFILTRNLLYTAVTRAKKMVVLVGDEKVVQYMVKNNYISQRFSPLKNFIFDFYEKYKI